MHPHLLADDHAMVRQGFRLILGAQPGYGDYRGGRQWREAVEMAGELQPDIIVMDVAMPELNGIEATRKIIAPPAPRT